MTRVTSRLQYRRRAVQYVGILAAFHIDFRSSMDCPMSAKPLFCLKSGTGPRMWTRLPSSGKYRRDPLELMQVHPAMQPLTSIARYLGKAR